MSNCTFCEIIYGTEEAEVVSDGISTVGIVPLNPVTDGHVIFIPRKHVRDALEDTDVTASVMQAACEYAGYQRSRSAGYQRSGSNLERLSRIAGRPPAHDYNIITSAGPNATQTINHLHIHVVPRFEDDGLTLPWTGQEK